jgi:membrane protease YdiL (CAAX protease family)
VRKPSAYRVLDTVAMKESRPNIAPLLVYVGLFFIVWTLRATVFYSFDASIESEALRNVYSNVAKLIIWVLPVFVYLIKVDKANPSRYLKLNTPVNKDGLFFALIIILIYFSGVLFISLFAQGKHIKLNFNSVALLSTSVSSLFEEILFRGFILNKLWESLSFWKANLLAAFLFSLAHLPNWLWTKGPQTQIVVDSLSVFMLACFLGYLVKKTNSLWPSVAAHITNNFLASFLSV